MKYNLEVQGSGFRGSPEGVLLFSSRDHQIVETTANRIMEIVNGKLIDKITTYDEYLANDEMARKRQVFTVTDSEEEDD